MTLGTMNFGWKTPEDEAFNPILGVNDGHGNFAYKMRKHLDASLSRLQTDHI